MAIDTESKRRLSVVDLSALDYIIDNFVGINITLGRKQNMIQQGWITVNKDFEKWTERYIDERRANQGQGFENAVHAEYRRNPGMLKAIVGEHFIHKKESEIRHYNLMIYVENLIHSRLLDPDYMKNKLLSPYLGRNVTESLVSEMEQVVNDHLYGMEMASGCVYTWREDLKLWLRGK
jgi:hypothetical protein